MPPIGASVTATHSGLLPLHPSLSKKAKTAHVLDGVTNALLISIGQSCDDDCIAVLDKQKLQAFKDAKCVLEGTCMLQMVHGTSPFPFQFQ
jgi:hypothetical protein